MPSQPPSHPCGANPHGSHPAHCYMVGRVLYQCPGSSPHRSGLVESPCPQWSLQEPHDAHDFESADGPARCPGWSEPDDGPGPQPGEPPTDAERIRDLEHTLQRAREVLGTDAVLVGCEEHEARITALEDALRDVLNTFIEDTHPGQPCKRSRHVDVDTVDRWHAVLHGEAS